MKDPHQQQIEPGLLQVFRLSLVIQWVLLALSSYLLLRKNHPTPDYMALLGLGETTFLLIYLSWKPLRRWLGRSYLPLALVIAAVGPELWEALGIAMQMNQGLRSELALIDSWRLYLWLLLPLVLISVQYGFRALFCFTIGTALLSIVLLLPMMRTGEMILAFPALNAGLRFVLYSVAGSVIVVLNKAQRRYREKQAEQQKELARYAMVLEQLTVSRERNRIARELHDTLAHTLSALSVQLQAIDALWESDLSRARDTLFETQKLTRSGLDEARRSLYELRSHPIESLGLVLAIRQAAEQAAARAGVQLIFTAPRSPISLSEEVEQQLYRIADEALTNIVRHAAASQAQISLKQESECLTLTIEDDGVGFVPEQPAQQGHYGLAGMRERALLIEAMLEIVSKPGKGTKVQVSLPR